MTKTLYNINTERAILSSVLFEPQKFDDISSKLEPHDLYMPFHRNMFNTMLSLKIKGKPLEELLIQQEMGANHDEIAFLDVMSANAVSNIEPYIEQLKEFTSKRELSKIALNIRKSIEEDGESSIETLQSAQNAFEKIRLNGFNLNLVNGNQLKDDLPKFVLKNWLPIPQSALSLISADGGVGKSWWAIQAGVRFVIESNFTKKAFLWLSEDPQPIIKDRARKIISFLGHSRDEEKILSLMTFTSNEPPSLLMNKGFKSFEMSPLFEAMRRQLKEYDFIIYDPLIDFYGGDENSNSEFGVFFKPFKKWAIEENKSILFLHHATKGNGGGFRGAGAIRTSMRIAYELDFLKNNKGEIIKNQFHERAVKLTKDNWGGGNIIKLHIGGIKAIQIVPRDKDFKITYENKNEDFFPKKDKITMPPIKM